MTTTNTNNQEHISTVLYGTVMARSSSELTNNNGKILLLLHVGFIVWMGIKYIGVGGTITAH